MATTTEPFNRLSLPVHSAICQSLIALANAGVSAQFVQAIAASGRARPSPEELVELTNAGVSASYVQTLAKYGYSTLGIDALIELANAGVSASYVAEMSGLGYGGLTADSLKMLANAGVTPSYVRDLVDFVQFVHHGRAYRAALHFAITLLRHRAFDRTRDRIDHFDTFVLDVRRLP